MDSGELYRANLLSKNIKTLKENIDEVKDALHTMGNYTVDCVLKVSKHSIVINKKWSSVCLTLQLKEHEENLAKMQKEFESL